jgi:hypothetical protein
LFSFESIPLSIEESEPIVNDMKNSPNIIHRTHITLSIFVPADISPYPTVERVVIAQYTLYEYYVQISSFIMPVYTTQVSGPKPSILAK